MWEFLRTLIKDCEIGAHKDATGWHLSARGGLGIATIVIIVLWLSHTL
jgi:hypothetical protein